MEKEEQVRVTFQLKKNELEKEEESLLLQRDKGIQLLEELEERAHYYLKDYVPDTEYLSQGMNEVNRLKETVYEATNQDRKQLEKQMEELEEDYYQELRQLTVENSEQKVRDSTC